MKRIYRSKLPCFVLDLKGNIVFICNSLEDARRRIGLNRQLKFEEKYYYRIRNKKYRVFPVDFYVKNYNKIKKLKTYSNERIETTKNNREKRIILCDLFPSEEFKNMQKLALRLGVTRETIRLKLNGSIIENKYNIRYKIKR